MWHPDELSFHEYQQSKDYQDDYAAAIKHWDSRADGLNLKPVESMFAFKIKEFFMLHQQLLATTTMLDFTKNLLDLYAQNCSWRRKNCRYTMDYLLRNYENIKPGGSWVDKVKKFAPADNKPQPITILPTPSAACEDNLL